MSSTLSIPMLQRSYDPEVSIKVLGQIGRASHFMERLLPAKKSRMAREFPLSGLSHEGMP